MKRLSKLLNEISKGKKFEYAVKASADKERIAKEYSDAINAGNSRTGRLIKKYGRRAEGINRARRALTQEAAKKCSCGCEGKCTCPSDCKCRKEGGSCYSVNEANMSHGNLRRFLKLAAKKHGGSDWQKKYSQDASRTFGVNQDKFSSRLGAASHAHHGYEKALGRPDSDWAGWYARRIKNEENLDEISKDLAQRYADKAEKSISKLRKKEIQLLRKGSGYAEKNWHKLRKRSAGLKLANQKVLATEDFSLTASHPTNQGKKFTTTAATHDEVQQHLTSLWKSHPEHQMTVQNNSSGMVHTFKPGEKYDRNLTESLNKDMVKYLNEGSGWLPGNPPKNHKGVTEHQDSPVGVKGYAWKPSNYKYEGRRGDGTHIFSEGGRKEIFARRPEGGVAGWHLRHKGHPYEFLSSLSEENKNKDIWDFLSESPSNNYFLKNRPAPEAEKDFVSRHTINDPDLFDGVAPMERATRATRIVDRIKQRLGYAPGEDEIVYADNEPTVDPEYDDLDEVNSDVYLGKGTDKINKEYKIARFRKRRKEEKKNSLDEITARLADRYTRHSANDFDDIENEMNSLGRRGKLKARKQLEHKRKNRAFGLHMAFNKLFGHSRVPASLGENLDEVSDKLLNRYIDANKKQRDNMDSIWDDEILHKREVGDRLARRKLKTRRVDEKLDPDASVSTYIHDIVHSKNKMFANDSKRQRIKRALGAYYHRHEDTLDELKRETMARYLDKATGDIAWRAAGYGADTRDYAVSTKERQAERRKVRQRLKGTHMAAWRLAKEEVENQLDEISSLKRWRKALRSKGKKNPGGAVSSKEPYEPQYQKEDSLDEISPALAGRYINRATKEIADKSLDAGKHFVQSFDTKHPESAKWHLRLGDKGFDKATRRQKGIRLATRNLLGKLAMKNEAKSWKEASPAFKDYWNNSAGESIRKKRPDAQKELRRRIDAEKKKTSKPTMKNEAKLPSVALAPGGKLTGAWDSFVDGVRVGTHGSRKAAEDHAKYMAGLAEPRAHHEKKKIGDVVKKEFGGLFKENLKIRAGAEENPTSDKADQQDYQERIYTSKGNNRHRAIKWALKKVQAEFPNHRRHSAEIIDEQILNERIAKINKAYTRHYRDNNQTKTYIEWEDHKGKKGRTEGEPKNPHMQALLQRAEREGVKHTIETW